MIRTWADREDDKIFNNEVSRRLGHQVSKVARRKLKMLNAATNVTDLRVPPGNRLEALKGDRKGRRPDGGREEDIEEGYPGRIGGQETKVMKQKRKLFDELMEGVDAMQQQREGKITLRSHEVEDLPPLEVDADLIRDTRERMHVSRAVFARRLRVSTRTLENWEQGRARPNAQAAALILMVRKFPDTLEKLSELEHRAA